MRALVEMETMWISDVGVRWGRWVGGDEGGDEGGGGAGEEEEEEGEEEGV